MENEETKQPWVLDNDGKANWAMKQIQDKQKELAEIEQHRTECIDQINEEYDKQAKAVEDELDSWANRLQMYAVDRLEGAKKKSVSLPFGKFGYRKQPPKITKDDTELLTYAEQSAPQYVKIKRSLDWAGLKKACKVDGNRMITEDGEILPGVTVEEQPDKFYLEVD